ncbi:MAG: transposase [Candidatus Omnitrophica bacterium]|nr:transposase [Candidatus Omnitrophota bacterium]
MPRKARELMDGGIYHVFNRGNNKMDLFDEPHDYECFKTRLCHVLSTFGAHLFHYCLMTNHFHLLLQIEKAPELGKIMHEVQLKYARYFKKRRSSVGHVFQEWFRSPRIPEESCYLQCGRYIERNPLKAKIVKQAEDYPYSSARYYVLGEKDDLMTPNVYCMDLGSTGDERRMRYEEFLDMEEPYRCLIDKSILHA